jgi:hypothetical protein
MFLEAEIVWMLLFNCVFKLCYKLRCWTFLLWAKILTLILSVIYFSSFFLWCSVAEKISLYFSVVFIVVAAIRHEKNESL